MNVREIPKTLRHRMKHEGNDAGFLPFAFAIAGLVAPTVCTVGNFIYKVVTSPYAISMIDLVLNKFYHWFLK